MMSAGRCQGLTPLGTVSGARPATHTAEAVGRITSRCGVPEVPIEILWLKCFEMLSECFVQVAQRVENGPDPGP